MSVFRFCSGAVVRTGAVLGVLVVLAGSDGGCQSGPQVSSHQLIEHQALIDFSGLSSAEFFSEIQTTIGTPRHWELLPTKRTAIYTHDQWRSPSTHTGVGVLCAHLPLPLSAQAVVWFAKQEYAKQAQDGRVIAEWTDALGRSWFEAENVKYHIRGYVVVDGFTAWIVYCGYRAKFPPNLAEISLAARALETAVPSTAGDPTGPHTPTTQPVAQGN